MSTATDTKTETTIQVFRVYIKATPQKIWDAITDPEWNARYGYPGAQHYDLKPGGRFSCPTPDEMRPMGITVDEVVDGEVLEVDPPHRLVQTYRFNFEPAQTAEGFTTVTFEIDEELPGLSRLTVTHDVTDAPIAAGMISIGPNKLQEGEGGWTFILNDLKSLLETGKNLFES